MCGISVSCLFVVATKKIEHESVTPPMQPANGLDVRSEVELENISLNIAVLLGNRSLERN